jgi:hypothetical protein
MSCLQGERSNSFFAWVCKMGIGEVCHKACLEAGRKGAKVYEGKSPMLNEQILWLKTT